GSAGGGGLSRWGAFVVVVGAGLRGLADVAVVQAADFRELHDLAHRGEFDWPAAGCVRARGACAPDPLSSGGLGSNRRGRVEGFLTAESFLSGCALPYTIATVR